MPHRPSPRRFSKRRAPMRGGHTWQGAVPGIQQRASFAASSLLLLTLTHLRFRRLDSSPPRFSARSQTRFTRRPPRDGARADGRPTPEATGVKSAKIWYTLTDEAPALATRVPTDRAPVPRAERRRRERQTSPSPAACSPRSRTGSRFRRGDRIIRRRSARSQGACSLEHRQAAQRLGVRAQLEAVIAELNAKGFDVPLAQGRRIVRRGEGDPGAVRQVWAGGEPVRARATRTAASPRPSGARRAPARWARGPATPRRTSRPCPRGFLRLGEDLRDATCAGYLRVELHQRAARPSAVLKEKRR